MLLFETRPNGRMGSESRSGKGSGRLLIICYFLPEGIFTAEAAALPVFLILRVLCRKSARAEKPAASPDIYPARGLIFKPPALLGATSI